MFFQIGDVVKVVGEAAFPEVQPWNYLFWFFFILVTDSSPASPVNDVFAILAAGMEEIKREIDH